MANRMSPDGSHNVVLDFVATGNDPAAREHRYLDGAAVDQVLAQENIGDDTANAVLWLLQDNLQSVRDVVNNAGQTINSIEYGPYGNILSITDPSNGNAVLSAAATRFLFTGQEWDANLGLYYYAQGQSIAGGRQGREYDPGTGTFLSLDPATDWVNGYIYAKNSPTNYVDPSGRDFAAVLGGVKEFFGALGDTFSSGEAFDSFAGFVNGIVDDVAWALSGGWDPGLKRVALRPRSASLNGGASATVSRRSKPASDQRVKTSQLE